MSHKASTVSCLPGPAFDKILDKLLQRLYIGNSIRLTYADIREYMKNEILPLKVSPYFLETVRVAFLHETVLCICDAIDTDLKVLNTEQVLTHLGRPVEKRQWCESCRFMDAYKAWESFKKEKKAVISRIQRYRHNFVAHTNLKSVVRDLPSYDKDRSILEDLEVVYKAANEFANAISSFYRQSTTWMEFLERDDFKNLFSYAVLGREINSNYRLLMLNDKETFSRLAIDLVEASRAGQLVSDIHQNWKTEQEKLP